MHKHIKNVACYFKSLQATWSSSTVPFPFNLEWGIEGMVAHYWKLTGSLSVLDG